MAEPSPATGRQLWRLNIESRIGAALERCPSGVINRQAARDELATFMPEKRKPPKEPIKPLLKELNKLEARADRQRRKTP